MMQNYRKKSNEGDISPYKYVINPLIGKFMINLNNYKNFFNHFILKISHLCCISP